MIYTNFIHLLLSPHSPYRSLSFSLTLKLKVSDFTPSCMLKSQPRFKWRSSCVLTSQGCLWVSFKEVISQHFVCWLGLRKIVAKKCYPHSSLLVRMKGIVSKFPWTLLDILFMKLSLELTYFTWDFASVLVILASVVELVLVHFRSFIFSSFGKCSFQAFWSFYETLSVCIGFLLAWWNS